MADADVLSTSSHDSAGSPAVEAPLCVDLDGTLIATDSLSESLLLLVKQSPADLLRLPGWLLKGRAYFKEQVASRVKVNAALLPYRADIIELIRTEKQAGRRVVLATASHQNVAAAVAEHVGLFDEVIASGNGANFKGPAKLAELERRYGKGNFDYVGDAPADVPLWKAARRAYVVETGGGALRKAQAVCTPFRVFPSKSGPKALLKALRPHQWVKNLLLFVPLILAHQLHDWRRITSALLAFWAFSFCASAIYIVNDLLDLESDRAHPTKRKRPFASGKLSAPTGLAMSAGLLVAAFSVALLIPSGGKGFEAHGNAAEFTGWLIVYLALTTAYSFWLKRKLLVDVILLSGLYTLRIIAGAAAINVELTMWLLAFSMFFFLSLAFAKRYSELIQVEDAGEHQISGRGYQVRDLRVIESIGPSSGYLAVLVFCNYLNDPRVAKLYANGRVLWLVAPVLLYWITRIWFVARRRQLHDDPIIFAIRDSRSHVCGILATGIVLIASVDWNRVWKLWH